MLFKLKPEKSIVPIVRAREDLPVSQLLGTGFFVGTTERCYVVTARHVIEGNPLDEGEKYAVAFREENGVRILEVPRIRACLDFDIAVFDGSGFPEAVPLALASADASLNADVFMYEYSSTRIEKTESGKTLISFEPYAHKGNIMRYFESSFPEARSTPSFITSFPALQGASGAPVLEGGPAWEEFAVTGMIVANVERHLLPAQIVKVEHDDSSQEEVRYFLPVGKGLARSVIVKVLTDLQVPFRYAERSGASA